ncbi:MAG: ArsR/SmtB family transcription factor [Christensenellales bacterium]|jgi:DNA-binding transcriptional ArsR family regulator
MEKDNIMPIKNEVPIACCNQVHADAIGHLAFPTGTMLSELSKLFRTYGDPTRLKLILALSQQELCVCDLCEVISMEQSAVSHQLRYLKQMHVVKSRRQGKSVFYSLDDNHIISILDQALAHVAHQSCPLEDCRVEDCPYVQEAKNE